MQACFSAMPKLSVNPCLAVWTTVEGSTLLVFYHQLPLLCDTNGLPKILLSKCHTINLHRPRNVSGNRGNTKSMHGCMHDVMICTLVLSISLSRWSTSGFWTDLSNDFGLSSRTARGTCADPKRQKKTRNMLFIVSNVIFLVPESRLARIIYNARKHSRGPNAPWKVQVSLLTLDQCT
uniref:Uncharacterized protein n=1 Tax=Rhipicephalus zambeziensis TaxID=60191 RepID=A0A224Y5P0_9ACAR